MRKHTTNQSQKKGRKKNEMKWVHLKKKKKKQTKKIIEIDRN